jgi:hypothetical protein
MLWSQVCSSFLCEIETTTAHSGGGGGIVPKSQKTLNETLNNFTLYFYRSNASGQLVQIRHEVMLRICYIQKNVSYVAGEGKSSFISEQRKEPPKFLIPFYVIIKICVECRV